MARGVRLVGAAHPRYALRMCVASRRAAIATLVAFTTLGVASPLSAEPASWLVLEGACPVTAAELSRRVEGELIGSRPVGARARVSIEPVAAGYSVTLRATRAGRDLGAKQLVLPSCDEAVDAAALVLAIALAEPTSEPAPATPPAEPPPDFSLLAPASAPERDAPPAVSAADERAPRERSRLGMLFGVETGTFPHPTPYLGASFALPLGAWEAWTGLRYGLPVEEEFVDTTTSERVRQDFGAFGLALCRGVGVAWRFSACAGGEFGVVRVDHSRREGDIEVDTDDQRARVAAVGTARISGLAGRVRPELEFSAAAASIGPGAAPTLSLRLGAGVGVQF